MFLYFYPLWCVFKYVYFKHKTPTSRILIYLFIYYQLLIKIFSASQIAFYCIYRWKIWYRLPPADSTCTSDNCVSATAVYKSNGTIYSQISPVPPLHPSSTWNNCYGPSGTRGNLAIIVSNFNWHKFLQIHLKIVCPFIYYFIRWLFATKHNLIVVIKHRSVYLRPFLFSP